MDICNQVTQTIASGVMSLALIGHLTMMTVCQTT